MVQKGELDIAKDRYLELKRRYDALRKEHEELIDAVRQAAREERKAQEAAAAPAPPPTAAPEASPPPPPPGE
jgi:chemotaxis response regulator CheB